MINQVKITSPLRKEELQHLIARLERTLDRQESALTRSRRLLERVEMKLGHLAAGVTSSASIPQGEDCSVPRVSTLTPVEVVSSLVHEVNQPLAAIATYGHACLRMMDASDENRDDLRSALGQIADLAEDAGRFIAHVYRRFVSGTPLRIPVQMNALIENVTGRLQRRILPENAILRLQLGENLPSVAGDPVELEQVLLNLLRNALEAMREIPAEQRQLTVSSRSDPNEVTVTVSDTGPGMTKEAASRLFQPVPSTKPGGMGLGLSLCSSIVLAHGGRLEARHNAGPGMTFLLSLPYQASA